MEIERFQWLRLTRGGPTQHEARHGHATCGAITAMQPEPPLSHRQFLQNFHRLDPRHTDAGQRPASGRAAGLVRHTHALTVGVADLHLRETYDLHTEAPGHGGEGLRLDQPTIGLVRKGNAGTVDVRVD